METSELKEVIETKFKESGLKECNYIPNTDKFRIVWDSDLKLSDYIFEVRPLKEGFAIGLFFEINTSTIIVNGSIYQYEYTGALTNIFEIKETINGYTINRLDKEYLRSSNVIVSDINGNTENKKLSINVNESGVKLW